MPQKRKYSTNAERQEAYRRRQRGAALNTDDERAEHAIVDLRSEMDGNERVVKILSDALDKLRESRTGQAVGGGADTTDGPVTTKERRNAGLCIWCGEPALVNQARNINTARRLARGDGLPSEKELGQTFERIRSHAYCLTCEKKRQAEHEKKKRRKEGKARSSQRRRSDLKDAGLCVSCGKNPARPNLKECQQCADRWIDWRRSLVSRRKDAGLCVDCGKNPARPNLTQCQRCTDHCVDVDRISRAVRKAAVR